MNPTVMVSAPAGSGKTTRLVQEYLGYLRSSSVDRVVAITFTRKAAGELVERVAGVLAAIAGVPTLHPISAGDRKLYEPHAPAAAAAREALIRLPSAPIATVDSFVLSLLQEHLLDAWLPIGGQRRYLDGPIELDETPGEHYREAARAALEEAGPEARVVLGHLTLSLAVDEIARLAQRRDLKRPSAALLIEAIAIGMAQAIANTKDPGLDEELAAGLNGGMEPFRAGVVAWLRDRKAALPRGFLPWLGALHARSAKTLRALRDPVVKAACRGQGLPPVDGTAFDKIAAEWASPEALAAADRLGSALATLAAAARNRGLASMASTGRLGHDELLLAATQLCREAPESLRHKYDAILVDEVQDTSPGQLEFYEALAKLRDGIRVFYVGDVRQSIYRFRGADPHGWEKLLAAAPRKEELKANFRSVPGLVRAQQAVFNALGGLGEVGVAELPELQAGRKEVPGPKPVRVVLADKDQSADSLALAAFARDYLKRKEAGEPLGRMAVLAATWELGRGAVARLDALGVQAWLAGERSLLQGRLAADLRLLLDALLDPTDDVAVAGLLKQPIVGLSDRGLLDLRGEGGLGQVLRPADPVHQVEQAARLASVLAGLSPEDRARIDAVRPALLVARERLGREPTADVLEHLFSGLRLRPILAAGPDGRDGLAVAQLEILLDRIRQAEASGTDPHAARQAITPADEGRDELPAVRLAQDGGVVEITTVHASKGREWDHVVLIGIGRGKGSSAMSGKASYALRTEEGDVLGVRVDPAGGHDASADPVGLVLSSHDSAEQRAEKLRLFYVGFTRAKETLTFGLDAPDKSGESLHAVIRQAIAGDEETPAPPGDVELIDPATLPVVERCLAPRERTGRVAAFEAAWAEANGVELAVASSLGAGKSDDAEVLRLRAELHAARRLGRGEGSPALPEAVAAAKLRDNQVGDLVHGWLERWEFRGEPAVTEADRYLRERWGLGEGAAAAPLRVALAEWLVETGRALLAGIPEFAALVRDGELFFEWPVLGATTDRVLTGRADLLVQKRDGTWAVIDFKAGPSFPRGENDKIPHDLEYACQLESYRRILEAAGMRVSEVGLVFVRGPKWVRRSFA